MPLLIQMPILCALFTLLQHLGDYCDGETFSFYGILPNLQTSVAATLPQGFGVAAPYVVALLLFAVLTLIPQLYMSRNQTGAQAQTMKTTAIIMSFFMLFIGWSLPAGVLLYYDVSSAWQVVQQIFVTQKVIDKAKAEEEERMANAPIEVDVVRREHKPRPHKKK